MREAEDWPAVAARAEQIAREAGALLMESLGRLEAGSIRTKSARRDLVTEVDLASERLIVAALRESFPDHAIEAEEETRDGGDEDGLRWFVDPLDGTVNFVHGLPAFAVSLGLYRGGQGLVGVVHAPRLGETWVASVGAGATLNGEAIRVSATQDLEDAVVATGFAYRRHELENSNLENFVRLARGVRGVRRMGSAAVDLAYTASGHLDAFWELHLAPHDVAAGAVLVREAGGVVTDADGGGAWLRGGSIVAGPRSLGAALVEEVDSGTPRGFGAGPALHPGDSGRP